MKTTVLMEVRSILGAVALASCIAAPAGGADTLGKSEFLASYCHGERWQRLACMSYAKAVGIDGIHAPKDLKLVPDQIKDPPIPTRKPIRAVRP
jgi:hypothetical protein